MEIKILMMNKVIHILIIPDLLSTKFMIIMIIDNLPKKKEKIYI